MSDLLLMWEFLILIPFAVAGIAGLHFWWRRRFAHLQNQLEQTTAALATAHEEQRHREARQQAGTLTLFDHMVEGVLWLDAAGRIQLANPSLGRMLGASGDVRGRTLLEAFRLPELTVLVERLSAERTILGHEFTLPGPEPRILQINAVVLLDDQNQSEGAILVFHDLTRVKQLEGARQEFVANVSHELRTPLTLIKGCVETLLDGAKDEPMARDRFLHTIEKHADRLTYLIEDLLTLSQLESGRIALNLRATRLRDVGARVIDSLEARARAKQVTLENQIPADLFAQVDGERLEQVLSNLVDNAIKYGRTGGHVIVQGERLADDRTRVSVQDDGPGIPPEAQERVFERFYRLDKARSREQGGTGLGLAIVKHIIQRHGGEVGLQSEVGHGSTFFFTLPAHST
jgi:two-component system phosphate regulon sensor histidine kinase PhoR